MNTDIGDLAHNTVQVGQYWLYIWKVVDSLLLSHLDVEEYTFSQMSHME